MSVKNGHPPSVHVRHIDHNNASVVIKDLLNVVCGPALLSGIKRVIVKINLCEYRRAESGAVTDPHFLEPLIIQLQQLLPDIPIAIAEADATSVDADSAFRYMSIDKVAESTGATLLNFSKETFEPVEIPRGLHFKRLDLPQCLNSDTLYVNFAKLKINSGTRITGCLKNNYALLRQKNKSQFHDVVDSVIHDLNMALHKREVRSVNIIDGYIGVETIGGPAFGRPKRCELILAGKDPVAVDACEARIIGVRPASVKHIVYCHRSDLGTMHYKLETDIAPFSYRKYKFKYERLQYWLRQRLKRRVGMGL